MREREKRGRNRAREKRMRAAKSRERGRSERERRGGEREEEDFPPRTSPCDGIISIAREVEVGRGEEVLEGEGGVAEQRGKWRREIFLLTTEKFLSRERGRERKGKRDVVREVEREKDPLFSFSLFSLITFSLKYQFLMISVSKNNSKKSQKIQKINRNLICFYKNIILDESCHQMLIKFY